MDRRSAGHLALPALPLMLLAACATPPPPSPAEFATMRDVLAASPEARAAVERQCRAEVAAKPTGEREILGALLDLDTDEVPQGFCARTVAGITRGDVTYADFVAISTGSEDRQLLRRFIRALRLDPSAVAI